MPENFVMKMPDIVVEIIDLKKLHFNQTRWRVEKRGRLGLDHVYK